VLREVIYSANLYNLCHQLYSRVAEFGPAPRLDHRVFFKKGDICSVMVGYTGLRNGGGRC
jgi:hypothetical protein